MKQLLNKTALVTGASRGIGKAIAMQLATEGCFVILHYSNDRAAADALLETVESIGGKGALIQATFGQQGAVETQVEQFDRVLGDKKLDILINNAGILHRVNLAEMSEEQYDELFDINVKAPFFLTQQLVPRMNDGGRIINLSS